MNKAELIEYVSKQTDLTKRARKARTGRNPQTGEAIKIRASKSVKFRPGKDFKGML